LLFGFSEVDVIACEGRQSSMLNKFNGLSACADNDIQIGIDKTK